MIKIQIILLIKKLIIIYFYMIKKRMKRSLKIINPIMETNKVILLISKIFKMKKNYKIQ